MSRPLPTLCATLCLLASAAAAAPPDGVLVPGDPPLTEETVARVGAFWAWMFGAPLTGDQQSALRQELTSIWRRNDRSGIQGAAGVVAQHLQLARLPEAEREVRRQAFLPQVVELLERSADQGISRWALALYRSSHQPLAAGTPPLTRQSSDAYLEVICFMSNQATGQAFVPDQAMKDSWASTLAAGYRELRPDQQAFIGRMPQLRAALAAAWPMLGAGERAQVLQQWTRQLGIQPGGAGAPPASSTAARPATGTDLKADLEAMKSQQSLYQGYSAAIMGSHYSSMNNLFSNGDKPFVYRPKW